MFEGAPTSGGFTPEDEKTEETKDEISEDEEKIDKEKEKMMTALSAKLDEIEKAENDEEVIDIILSLESWKKFASDEGKEMLRNNVVGALKGCKTIDEFSAKIEKDPKLQEAIEFAVDQISPEAKGGEV